MRDWGINPRLLCRKHLLGNHVELHMCIGSMKRHHNLSGYFNGLIDINNIINRHEDLVKEMKRRGYEHKSNINSIDFQELLDYYNERYSSSLLVRHIQPLNIQFNIDDLKDRCSDCKKLIENNSDIYENQN